MYKRQYYMFLCRQRSPEWEFFINVYYFLGLTIAFTPMLVNNAKSFSAGCFTNRWMFFDRNCHSMQNYTIFIREYNLLPFPNCLMLESLVHVKFLFSTVGSYFVVVLVLAFRSASKRLPWTFESCIQSVSYTHLDVYKRQ